MRRLALAVAAILTVGTSLGACASSGEQSCALPSPSILPAAAGASPIAADDPVQLRRGTPVVVTVDFAVSCTDTRPGAESTANPGRRTAVTVEIASGTYVKRLVTVDSDSAGKVSAPVVIPADAPAGKAVLRVSGALERELQLS